MSSPRTRCRASELLHESAQNLRHLPTPKWVKLESPVPHPPVPHVPSGRGSPAAAGHCAGPHSPARERHPKQVKWIGHHVEEPERDPGAFPPLPAKSPRKASGGASKSPTPPAALRAHSALRPSVGPPPGRWSCCCSPRSGRSPARSAWRGRCTRASPTSCERQEGRFSGDGLNRSSPAGSTLTPGPLESG